MVDQPQIREQPAGEVTPADPEHRDAMLARLQSLATTLSIKRSEAIQARKANGIEQIWEEDESFYDGIDDHNRGEERGEKKTRMPGQKTEAVDNQSTIFVNITRPYVNAAASKVSDILMPTDRGMFSLHPTPVPELIGVSKGELPKPMLNQIGTQFAGQPEQAANAAESAVKQATEALEESRAKADKAQKRIEDWHIESQYHAHNRMMIKDAAKAGTGILKGPVPVRRKQTAMKEGALVINEETKPASSRVSYWNCYPDGACGEDIQNGSYHWEKDRITSRQLRKLKGGDYLDDEIDAVLREEPMRALGTDNHEQPRLAPGKGPYEIWYFYGDLDKEDMLAAGCECDKDSIPALVTMVNDHVIKGALNPLDSGEFPYDYFPWPQAREGMPWGTGIARAGRTPQRIVTAGWRAMMDNAGRAAGPQFIHGTQVTPDNGISEIAPWKGWSYAEDADIDDVRKAFAYIEAPMRQAELANIIQMGMKAMEDTTGLPMLLQGQQGQAPDLVGVVQILNTNASSFLRDLGRSYDDYITERHIRRYYAWLLQYGEDDEKGEFVIDARGSSTNVERELQNQELMKMLQAALNPAYGLDPKKAMEEYLVSRHFDPKKFTFSDQEWLKVVQAMSQKPPDQRLAVEQFKAQANQQSMQVEQAFEAKENEKDRQSDQVIATINERLQSAQLTSDEQQTLAKIKATLSTTVIKGNLQRDLSNASIQDGVQRHGADLAVDMHKHHNPQVMTPPVEPKGRAAPGMAYQQ